MEHEITEKFGEFLRSKCGISPRSTAILSTLIIGLVCVYSLVKRQWRLSKEKRILLSSKLLAEMYGGDLAWRRLNNYKAALAIPNDTLDQTSLLLKGLLDVDEQHLDLNKIQGVMEKLEIAGKEEGLEILKSAHGQHSDKSFFHHEIALVLVELLIYKGNLKEALRWECLDYQRIQFDARPPFLKAIIHGMLGKWDEAENNWNDFVDVRDSLVSIVGEGTLPAGTLHRTDFPKFKKRVQNLEKEILKTKQ